MKKEPGMTKLKCQVLQAIDYSNFYQTRLKGFQVGNNAEAAALCPFHEDHNPSLSVNIGDRSKQGAFYCHACGVKGIVFDFVAQRQSISFDKAIELVASEIGILAANQKPVLVATYDYCDGDGSLLFQVCRYKPKKFRQRRPDGKGEWVWNLGSVQRVLYRLPELLASPEATVYLVEGEEDTDRLAKLGFLATTNSGGAKKWKPQYSRTLKGRDVVILPDNDGAGHKHARKVATELLDWAASVKIVPLPGLAKGQDVSDWLDAGHTIDELQELVRSQSTFVENGTPAPHLADAAQADRLIHIVDQENVELFHDEVGECFARISIGGHKEIWPCSSKNFKRWLCLRFWELESKAPTSNTIGGALNVIESRAEFHGQQYHLSNRTAYHEQAIYYDLTDPDWRSVRVTPEGWAIEPNPPVLFRHYAHQAIQIEPKRGGKLSGVLPFVNICDEQQQMLLLIYIVSCYVPNIPHPILLLHGPQGAAKTTLFRMLRRLVDPSEVEVLVFHRHEAQLIQQLSHHLAPYYDNLSDVPGSISDIFARAATGQGFSKRQLYSDDSDIIYKFRRCVGLNGINVVARKPDLLDRCLLFGLEPIEPNRRRTEQELRNDFEAQRPFLLGAAFDALSTAMKILPGVQTPYLPRMADFARWSCAIAEALDYRAEDFMAAYEANIRTRNDEVLNDDVLASIVMGFMETHEEWEGTPSELLAALQDEAGKQSIDTKSKRWPKAPNALSRRLNILKTNLEAAGIRIDVSRGRKRLLTLRRLENTDDTVDTDGDSTTTNTSSTSENHDNDDTSFPCQISSTVSSSHNPPQNQQLDGIDGFDGIFPDSDASAEQAKQIRMQENI